jgi:malonyl-CoA decarboxylase
VGLAQLLRWRPRSKPDTGSDGAKSVQKIVSLSRELLLDGGGMDAGRVAADILRLYKLLNPANQRIFWNVLTTDFSPKPDDVGRAAEAYRLDPSSSNLRQLQLVVEPPRQELFRRLNMAPDGTRELIEMRRQVLKELDDSPHLEPIAADLGHLLASWFNAGFLTLERIDWRSPAVVLEKLIAYEAVHQIQGWNDLRRRLEADRRCYAFFHSALPGEPIIFIEVALTRGMSDRIQPLIEPEAPIDDPESADSAIFYSITNCQQGLRGVRFGSSLIKQVVEDLKKNLPRIKTYATLSPVPGFRKWLDRQANQQELKSMLDQPDSADAGQWSDNLRQQLLSACARYLLHAKRDREPLDSVARFHLKNGARLERINWMGDPSPGGMKQSAGLMVNYVYELSDLQHNYEMYTRSGEIACARRVERLARQTVRGKAAPSPDNGSLPANADNMPASD